MPASSIDSDSPTPGDGLSTEPVDADLRERRTRRRLVLLSLVPVVAVAALLIWGTARSGGQPGGLFTNSSGGEVEVDLDLAHDFSVTTFGGEPLTLSGLRGKVVMIDFWASWCPPCRLESPDLVSVYRLFKDRDVEFVGIDVWDSESAGRRFVAEEGIPYPNALDTNGFITIDYGVTGIPEKFFIDREGRVVRKYVGPIRTEELARILNEILRGS
jgi:cytochrome c biogenesis protein CcmG/thiol:disulfide interchange protein DsbE